MMRLRVTKYDPKNRDAEGRYSNDEFTSWHDTGRMYGNHVLTADDYVLIEDDYVTTVREFLSRIGIDNLVVCELEDRQQSGIVNASVDKIRPASIVSLSDGMTVKGNEIEMIVRLAIRELIWCKLTGSHNTYIHFGYDLYMYLGTDAPILPLVPCSRRVFYEPLESPYV